jgi:acetyltransferase-like isoleucine patch superfamily enzyme
MMLRQLVKIGRFLKMVNLKTIYFNFKYFPTQVAIKLPILISRHVILKQCEGKVYIEGEISTGQIRIGYNDVSIFDRQRSKSILEISGEMTFRGKALLGHGSRISIARGGKLIFGDNFEITAASAVICYHEIEFGTDCLLSWDILLMDTDLHPIVNGDGEIINAPRKISIGDHVWIGCRSTILKGSIIASGNVIAAGTVVSSKLTEQNSIYGSNPCRILKENIHWKH